MSDAHAASIWYDTEEYQPPTEEWLLTWWGEEVGLLVAWLSLLEDGNQFWMDWNGDTTIRPSQAMPLKWARISVPKGGRR